MSLEVKFQAINNKVCLTSAILKMRRVENVWTDFDRNYRHMN